MVVPGTIVHDTASISTSPRVIFRVLGVPSSPARTVSSTVVPDSPRIRSTTSSSELPAAGTPSTSRMMSPVRRPALSAGLSWNTVTTRGSSLSVVSSWTPIPTYDPDSESLREVRSSGVMKSVWPVSPTASASPSIAP